MNRTAERAKMVKAMEYIARQINDEEIFESWLISGVADGDIEYGDLEYSVEQAEDMEYYTRDDNFRDLMDLFLRLMKRAKNSGGLYCGGIVTEAR